MCKLHLVSSLWLRCREQNFIHQNLNDRLTLSHYRPQSRLVCLWTYDTLLISKYNRPPFGQVGESRPSPASAPVRPLTCYTMPHSSIASAGFDVLPLRSPSSTLHSRRCSFPTHISLFIAKVLYAACSPASAPPAAAFGRVARAASRRFAPSRSSITLALIAAMSICCSSAPAPVSRAKHPSSALRADSLVALPRGVVGLALAGRGGTLHDRGWSMRVAVAIACAAIHTAIRAAA